MGAGETQTYMDALLTYECGASAQSAFDGSSAAGAGGATAPPQGAQSQNAGENYMIVGRGGGWALGVASSTRSSAPSASSNLVPLETHFTSSMPSPQATDAAVMLPASDVVALLCERLCGPSVAGTAAMTMWGL
ncbi:hypothetical protein C8J57DRAFT_1722609 [Mycena rebaudengoi]|nr:hypothetical protein C8J57DRAFT_1722609 [Mycena rebaudengoi]